MRPGTPGFRGDRLREARLARGIGTGDMASLIGISASQVGHYERGTSTPSPEKFGRIVALLRMPKTYFLSPPPEEGRSPLLYRSLAATTAASRDRQEGWANWLVEAGSVLLRYVDFPSLDIPDLGDNRDPELLSEEEIEGAASELRRHWGMGDGPISNMCWLLENKGVVTSVMPMEDRGVDGHSCWSVQRAGDQIQARPYMMLNAESSSPFRQRFTCGEELAHLVLHRHAHSNRRANVKLRDQQAKRFAGAFLLPPETFLRGVSYVDLDTLRVLKGQWKVSIGAMIERAWHLGLLTENQRTGIWINYTRRGWKKNGEPLDGSIEAERPRVLRRAVEVVLSQGIRSGLQLAEEFPPGPRVLEQLAGLEQGHLTRDSAPDVTVKDQETTDVIPFRRKQG